MAPEHFGNLIVRLSHELAVALELSFEPGELSSLWPDAIDALGDAQTHLKAHGLGTPPVVRHVIALAATAVRPKSKKVLKIPRGLSDFDAPGVIERAKQGAPQKLRKCRPNRHNVRNHPQMEEISNDNICV